MYFYVMSTWLIANLIHPFIIFVVFGSTSFSIDMFGFGIQFLVYSIMFSLPSLLFSIFAVYGITKLPLSDTGKYITWLITAPALVFINYWLLFVVFLKDDLSSDALDFILPGMLSAVVIILIRFPAFFRAVAELNKEKNETGLV